MKVGFIGAGFIARFQAMAIHQVRGLEIAGALEKATASRDLLAIQYNEADLYGHTDGNRDMLAELDDYVPLIRQGSGSAQLLAG